MAPVLVLANACSYGLWCCLCGFGGVCGYGVVGLSRWVVLWLGGVLLRWGFLDLRVRYGWDLLFLVLRVWLSVLGLGFVDDA